MEKRRERIRLAILLLIIGTFCAQTTQAQQQRVGVDICACQPGTYEFTLDFALTCQLKTIQGPGIGESSCVVDTQEGLNVTDMTPVQVSEIQVLELDQQLRPIAQTPYQGSYVTGDSISYTSVIVSQTDTLTAETMPKGLQLVITGINSLDQALINTWLVLYDNSCDIFPVMVNGQQSGWTEMRNLGYPPATVCPLAATAPPATAPPLPPPETPPPLPPPETLPPLPPPETLPPLPPPETPPPQGKGKGKGVGGKKGGEDSYGGKKGGNGGKRSGYGFGYSGKKGGEDSYGGKKGGEASYGGKKGVGGNFGYSGKKGGEDSYGGKKGGEDSYGDKKGGKVGGNFGYSGKKGGEDSYGGKKGGGKGGGAKKAVEGEDPVFPVEDWKTYAKGKKGAEGTSVTEAPGSKKGSR